MSTSPRTLLKKVFQEAETEEWVDFKTINFAALQLLNREKLYGPGITWGILWRILTTACFSVYEPERERRKLTQEEQKEIIDKIHEKLSNAPYKYEFFFKLPEEFPLTALKINSYTDIFTPDKKYIESLEEKNPPSVLDQIRISIGASYKKPNPYILEPATYLRVKDEGLVLSGEYATLNSTYSPDRLLGIYLGAILVYGGAISTDHYRLHDFSPKVYIDKEYVTNFRSPWRRAEARAILFEKDQQTIRDCSDIFKILVTPSKIKIIEEARKQICNAMYWIGEYLNAEETNLKITFAVSIIDSLFPPRKNAAKQKHYPTAQEKVTTIADLVSEGEFDRQAILNQLDELFDRRNNVIHGLEEIYGYTSNAVQEAETSKNFIDGCFSKIQEYINIRISKLVTDAEVPD